MLFQYFEEPIFHYLPFSNVCPPASLHMANLHEHLKTNMAVIVNKNNNKSKVTHANTNPVWSTRPIDFTVRNWGQLCYVIRGLKFPDLASTRFRIHSGLKKNPLWRAYSQSPGFASEFAGYVWTEGASGKKK